MPPLISKGIKRDHSAMEDGESAITTAPAEDTNVKKEVKDEDLDVKNEDADEEVGDMKEHYDQDIRVGGKGATYRVTLMLVGKPISYPDESTPDDWCNLPFESLRALDSATLAFVRYPPLTLHITAMFSAQQLSNIRHLHILKIWNPTAPDSVIFALERLCIEMAASSTMKSVQSDFAIVT